MKFPTVKSCFRNSYQFMKMGVGSGRDRFSQLEATLEFRDNTELNVLTLCFMNYMLGKYQMVFS